MLMDLIIYAIIYAVVSNVYILILSKEQILNWWFRFGLRFEETFFWKPLFGCEKCLAGQLAFWTYLLNWINAEFEIRLLDSFVKFTLVKYSFDVYSVLYLIFSTSVAILVAMLISKTITKIKNG